MDNKDLVWDLDVFRKRQRAKELILGIENQLCVFSSSVEQLYTNYDIFFPKDQNRKLVILPNPYAAHDTFQGIPESSVKPTGLFLLSDEQGSELKLLLPINREQKKYKTVPLEIGLKLINSKMPAGKPFLPVVMKGDLREFNQETPCLHLHSLSLGQAEALSQLDIKAIEGVILDRLNSLEFKPKAKSAYSSE
ncbi:hypothetical protein [Agaribacterium haliotis]|uniref:hypothetical protein n=1 Tax=Agaribacterium haliotis TaxID=2013869 RepID=UPI000BB59B2E|nr:hypothetical protein [Agaribacterium haliotis]